MNTNKRLIIAFKGLSEGLHKFSFKLGNDFFQSLDYSEFSKGDFEAKILLDKKTQFLAIEISLKGEVEVSCDRCLDLFNMPFKFIGNLHVKFSSTANESESENDELMILSPDESEIDLTHYVYESICLSLPYQRLHPTGARSKSTCNKDMLKLIKTINDSEHESVDPRWEKLKNLNNNN